MKERTIHTKRIMAGMMAVILGMSGILFAHTQAVRAADLTFIQKGRIPEAEIEDAGSEVTAPAFNAENFTSEVLNDTLSYNFADKSFFLIRTEDEGQTYLMLAQEKSSTTAAYSSSGLATANTVIEAANASIVTTDAEKAAIKATKTLATDDIYKEGNLSATNYTSGSNVYFYPLLASEINYAVTQIEGNTVWALSHNEIFARGFSGGESYTYWTRSRGANGAYYVDIPNSAEYQYEHNGIKYKDFVLAHTEPSGEEIPDAYSNPYMTQLKDSSTNESRQGAKYYIPSFRLDMTKVMMETTAANNSIEPDKGLLRYNPESNRNANNIKYMIKDTANNTFAVDSATANKRIANVYLDDSVVIGYKNAKLPAANENKYISALVYDTNGKILDYGRLDTVETKKGNVEVYFPKEIGMIEGGTYTLALFEETVNEGNKTNTCSEPVYLTFTVNAGAREVHTETTGHLDNFYKDMTGNTIYYLNGNAFRYVKINNDSTLMLVAKEPWVNNVSWNITGIWQGLDTYAQTAFGDTEKEKVIRKVSVNLAKYEDGTGNEHELYAYPITKTDIDEIKSGAEGINRNALTGVGTDFWTSSYVNKSKAWFYDASADELKKANRTENKDLLPAINIDTSNILFELPANEKGTNVSYGNEPLPYNPEEHSTGVKYVVTDNTDETNLMFRRVESTEITTENINKNAGETISGQFFMSTYTEHNNAATALDYLDVIIYPRGTENDDKILYFGRICEIPAGASAGWTNFSFNLPETIKTGQYKIALTREVVYADEKVTNIAGNPLKIDLTIESEAQERIVQPIPISGNDPSGGNIPTDHAVGGITNEVIAKNIAQTHTTEGEEIVFDTTTGNENRFLLYNAPSANAATLYTIAEDYKKSNLTFSNAITGLNATQLESAGFTETEIASVASTGGKKLFIPAYDELLDTTQTDYATIPRVKKSLIDKTEIGTKIDKTVTASYAWTATDAPGTQNAYIITNGEFLNGGSDLKNKTFAIDAIYGANLDLSAKAVIVDEATKGRYNPTSPKMMPYNLIDAKFTNNAKPYYVAERLSLNSNIGTGSVTSTGLRGGSTYTISYDNATPGDNMYISAIIFKYDSPNDYTNGRGYPISYGRLAKINNSGSGSAEITLPKSDDFQKGTNDIKYVLAVFAEEDNAANEFNYMSDPVCLQFNAGNIVDTKEIGSCLGEAEDTVYDGTDQTPAVTLYEDEYKTVTVPENYYDVTYYTNEACTVPANGDGSTVREQGIYYAKAVVNSTGINNGYKDSNTELKGIRFKVARDLGDAVLSVGTTYVYEKNVSREPEVTVSLDGVEIPASNYTVSYNDNEYPGQATATATAKKDSIYTGSVAGHFTINKANMATNLIANVSVSYDGKAHAIVVEPDDSTLHTDVDNRTVKTVSYNRGGVEVSEAKDAGVYTVNWSLEHPWYNKVTGSNTITITPRDITGADVELEYDEYSYTTQPVTPNLKSLSIDIGSGERLILSANDIRLGRDYTVACENNVDIGNTARITFTGTGTGNITGSVSKTFSIVGVNLDNANITATDVMYANKPVKPIVSLDGSNIVSGNNVFKFTWRRGDNTTIDEAQVKDAGTYKVTVSPKDGVTDIQGSKTVSFNVVPYEMNAGENYTKDFPASITYTGSPIIPDGTITVNDSNNFSINGVTLVRDTDYTVTPVGDCTNATDMSEAVAHALITFTGNYKGSTTHEFEIESIGMFAEGTMSTEATYTGELIYPDDIAAVNSSNEEIEGYTAHYAITTVPDKESATIPPAAYPYTSIAGAITGGQLRDVGTYAIWFNFEKANHKMKKSASENKSIVDIRPADMSNDITVAEKVYNTTDPSGVYYYDADMISLSGNAVGSAISYSGSENGSYSADINSVEFDSNGGIIFVKFEKANYNTVIKSTRVSVNRGIPYLSFENVGEKTYNRSAYTVRCIPMYDSTTVTYSWNDGNGNSGTNSTTPPSFTNVGTYTVTMVLNDPNYPDTDVADNTHTRTLTIREAEVDTTVTSYQGTYDGRSHSIDFIFNNFPNPTNSPNPDTRKVEIALTENANPPAESAWVEKDSDAAKSILSQKNAGNYYIHWRISGDNLRTTTGYTTIRISKKEVSIDMRGYDGPYDKNYHKPTYTITGTVDNNYSVYFKDSSTNGWVKESDYRGFSAPNTNEVVDWKFESAGYSNRSGDSGSVRIKIGSKTGDVEENTDIAPSGEMRDENGGNTGLYIGNASTMRTLLQEAAADSVNNKAIADALAAGMDLYVEMVYDESVPVDDKNQLRTKWTTDGFSGFIKYFNVDIVALNRATNAEIGKIHTLTAPVEFSYALDASNNNKFRYKVYEIHGGNVIGLPTITETVNGVKFAKFSSNNFSPFAIVYEDINPDLFTVDFGAGETPCEYTGTARTPGVVVRYNGTLLTQNTDYTVAYENNINPGQGTVRVTGIGTYAGAGTKAKTFNIVIAHPDNAKFTATVPSPQIYTGEQITPVVTAKYNGLTMIKDTDYTVAYGTNIEPGQNAGTVTVTPIGATYGALTPKTLYFTITVNGDLFTATIPQPSYEYTGSPITPAVTVKYGETVLIEGTDYTKEYSNNTEKGTATITITGKGYYAGLTRTINFAITKGGPSGDIKNVISVLWGAEEYTYTTKAIKPTVLVLDNDTELTKGVDYQLTYQNNTDCGTAKVIVSGMNTYAGYRNELSFTITQKNISASDVKVEGIEDKDYTGENIVQSPTVKYGGKTLKKGTDYRLTYANNKKVGTATVTITGINNFTGSADYDFEIKESDKSKEDARKTSLVGSTGSAAEALANGRLPVDIVGSVSLANAKIVAGGKSPKTNDQGTMPIGLGIVLVVIAGLGTGFIIFRRIKAKRA